MLKPNTLTFNSSGECFTFTITNFKNEIDVIYRGELVSEFRESDNIILTGYLPNEEDRTKFIAYSYYTNHSMEVENWQGSTGAMRNKDLLVN